MKKTYPAADVIEIPHARERAVERITTLITDTDLPMEQLWSMCRLLENFLSMDATQARTLECLSDQVAQGRFLRVTYEG